MDKKSIMKQIFLFLIIFLFLLQGTSFSKDVEITVHNNSELTKTISFRWMNNPAGCYIGSFGKIHCTYSVWVSEMKPGEIDSYIVEDAVGQKYCIEWENTSYDKRTDESTTNICFEITEDIEEAFITPNKILRKTKGIPI